MGFLRNTKTPQTDNQSAISDSLLTLTDVIAPSAVSINPRSINISGTQARVFYAVSYPRYLNDGWLEPILNMEPYIPRRNSELMAEFFHIPFYRSNLCHRLIV